MVRIGIATGEVQVVFITNSVKLPQKNALIREINQRLPQVVSIMQNVQNKNVRRHGRGNDSSLGQRSDRRTVE